MARKAEDIKNAGKKFSKDYQPSNESKRVPKRITKFKQALEHFSEVNKSRIEGVDFTFESNIAYVLFDKANKGDLQAIKLLIDVFGWSAPTKTANTNANGEDVENPLDKLIKSGGKIVINGK